MIMYFKQKSTDIIREVPFMATFAKCGLTYLT